MPQAELSVEIDFLNLLPGQLKWAGGLFRFYKAEEICPNKGRFFFAGVSYPCVATFKNIEISYIVTFKQKVLRGQFADGRHFYNVYQTELAKGIGVYSTVFSIKTYLEGRRNHLIPVLEDRIIKEQPIALKESHNLFVEYEYLKQIPHANAQAPIMAIDRYNEAKYLLIAKCHPGKEFAELDAIFDDDEADDYFDEIEDDLPRSRLQVEEDDSDLRIRNSYYVTRALEEQVHDFRLVHRDIKPDNIIVCEKEIFDLPAGDPINIIDYNLAKKVGEASKNRIVGAYLYMAPEVLRQGCTNEFAMDVYSYGLVLYAYWHGGFRPGTSLDSVQEKCLEKISLTSLFTGLLGITNSEKAMIRRVIGSVLEPNVKERWILKKAFATWEQLFVDRLAKHVSAELSQKIDLQDALFLFRAGEELFLELKAPLLVAEKNARIIQALQKYDLKNNKVKLRIFLQGARQRSIYQLPSIAEIAARLAKINDDFLLIKKTLDRYLNNLKQILAIFSNTPLPINPRLKDNAEFLEKDLIYWRNRVAETSTTNADCQLALWEEMCNQSLFSDFMQRLHKLETQPSVIYLKVCQQLENDEKNKSLAEVKLDYLRHLKVLFHENEQACRFFKYKQPIDKQQALFIQSFITMLRDAKSTTELCTIIDEFVVKSRDIKSIYHFLNQDFMNMQRLSERWRCKYRPEWMRFPIV